ncbi:MAG: thiolase family protein [Thermoplasmataceae archaeon]|jgi:acetyl-CoA acetyltransferase family protein|nr:thiolase family protein [Candidatus Thermoplasmatota archaeon]
MDDRNQSYIIDAARSPIGKRNGSLACAHPVDLAAGVLNGLISRSGINPESIDDCIVGCVGQINEQGMNVARNIILSAGLPESIPAVSIDRQCGSSLQAIQFAAQSIESGYANLVVAGGVESMSKIPLGSTINEKSNPVTDAIRERYALDNGWFSQAKGAAIIAKRKSMTRKDLDQFSLESHMRASAAGNLFKREILPYEYPDGQIVAADEGIRSNTSLEALSNLKEAFPGVEMITAGNSSQISDGASFAVIASSKFVKDNNIKPRGRFVSFSAVGVDPVSMLTGPVPATYKALDRVGMTIEDIDCFEINEAFAPVVLSWEMETGVDHAKVNMLGGAIALGHPVGATGSRLVTTMLNILETKKLHTGLIAICEGGGMANACIIERIE